MKKAKTFLQNNRHFIILLYYIVVLLGYQLLNLTTAPRHYMHHPIDDYIPFVPIMVIPYILWYFLITVSLIYLGFTCKQDFYRLALFIFGGTTICFIIYYFFPNGQNLRPLITNTDIFSKMISLIYSIDKPTNSAPSIHVLDTMAVFFALKKNKKLNKIKSIQISSTIITILIIMSTVMIKQHSILDVIYGLLLSFVLYFTIYIIPVSINPYAYNNQIKEKI